MDHRVYCKLCGKIEYAFCCQHCYEKDATKSRKKGELSREIVRLEAENAALKEALRNIINNWDSGELVVYWADGSEHEEVNFDSARALLEEKG